MVLVPPIFSKFSSSHKKCDVPPESITNFNAVCFAFSDLCLPPDLFLGLFFFLVVFFHSFHAGILLFFI